MVARAWAGARAGGRTGRRTDGGPHYGSAVSLGRAAARHASRPSMHGGREQSRHVLCDSKKQAVTARNGIVPCTLAGGARRADGGRDGAVGQPPRRSDAGGCMGAYGLPTGRRGGMGAWGRARKRDCVWDDGFSNGSYFEAETLRISFGGALKVVQKYYWLWC